MLSEDGKSVAIGARKNDGLNGTDSGHIRVFDYVPLLKKWIQKGDDIEGQASFSSSDPAEYACARRVLTDLVASATF